MFINQPLATGLEITVPHPDMVTVLINFQTQDSNRTGASLVLAPDSDKPQLSLNPTLSMQKNEKGWSWFRV
uniref:hypothetical protein n=1 Tax=Pseudomonas viridiflava TaxID=33069 RepID=UPI0013CEBE6F